MKYIKNNKAFMDSRGFTLIEMLVSVSILVLIVAVVLLVINPEGARRKVRDARRINDIMSMKTALELYVSDKKFYPLGNAAVGCSLSGIAYWQRIDSGVTNTCLYAELVNGSYIGSLPLDPSRAPAGSAPADPCTSSSTVPYRYNYWSDSKSYVITAILESPNGNQGHVCSSLPNWTTASCGTPIDNCYGIQNP